MGTATSGTSGSGTGMASYVVVASCVHAAPTVVVSPTSRTAAPGVVAMYTVTVTNNDAACSSGSFALVGSGPSGTWSHAFTTSPLTIASGASASTTWSVTSDAAAADGDYTVTATASSASSGNGSVTANYTVMAPPPVDAGIDAPTDAGMIDAGTNDASSDDANPGTDAAQNPDGATGTDAPFGPDAGDEPPAPGGCCGATNARGTWPLAALVLAAVMRRRRRRAA